MTQPRRLPSGGRIDRGKAFSFTFNGRRLEAYAGDTVASALLANGVRIVARSFKYHRPRGIVGQGAEEPNALLQVGQGAFTTPNPRATQTEVYDGLVTSSVNCWPGPDTDLHAVLNWFSRALPAGFYYKTFMWPSGLWPTYERFIRRAAGFGRSPTLPDPERYEHRNAHCDVFIAGGGPAGLAAALMAGRAGARVLLVDEQNEFGGSLLGTRDTLDGRPALEWLERVRAELDVLPEVEVLDRTTAVGYHDHNALSLLQRCRDHFPPAASVHPRQRLWRVRAKQVVLATGAFERPLVFVNNDRPGVMMASAVSTYVNRYAVAPGSRAVVFTNNDSAYATALDLHEAGVAVAAVVDVRTGGEGTLVRRVREKGIDVLRGHALCEVKGARGVRSVVVMALNDAGDRVVGEGRRIDCDLVAMSGGWSPAVHLHAHSGGRPRYDQEKACFVPGDPVQPEVSAGACNGTFQLDKVIAEGFAAGARAARAAGFEIDGAVAPPAMETIEEQPLQPLWRVPTLRAGARAGKQFVDIQNDTTAADIELAVREGYRSIEHVKRYTLLGFGTDQGKLGNINGAAIAAAALGVDIAATGTTTFRPPYTPVTFGAVAGRNVGRLFDPVRKTALHEWHEQHGALFENVGQWKRPWYYPRTGEDMRAAVNRECLAARNGLAIMDASTLGKIDIRGRDASEFLNRVYTNAWSKLGVGRCRYGLMLGEDGMVFDDGVTTRLDDQHYFMTTTTGGAARVMSWLERWLQTEWPELEVYLTSQTDHWATIGVVGPHSRAVMKELTSGIDLSADEFEFMSVRTGQVAGVAARVYRISFTGELSYEVSVNANQARHVWDAIWQAGLKYDITPYGTETMHVLRAEKGFIIVGQDTDGSVTPQDLGMDWIVSKKKDFLGRRSLDREDTKRADRKQLVGLLTDAPKEVLPEGAQLTLEPRAQVPVPMVGHVTSSYFSACLDRSIALALLKSGRSRIGEAVHAPLVDGRVVTARIVDPVFYDAKGERQHA